jgi:transporter family-2 protein
MELALASLALLAGGLLAVQAAANLQLGKATGNPLAASTLQLGVGATLLLALAAPAGALGTLDPKPDATWWH